MLCLSISSSRPSLASQRELNLNRTRSLSYSHVAPNQTCLPCMFIYVKIQSHSANPTFPTSNRTRVQGLPVTPVLVAWVATIRLNFHGVIYCVPLLRNFRIGRCIYHTMNSFHGRYFHSWNSVGADEGRRCKHVDESFPKTCRSVLAPSVVLEQSSLETRPRGM